MNRVLSSSQTAVRAAASTMASSFKKVTHVIFDMDGLLLDTERLYTQATQNILDPYGKTYTWAVKETLMGMQSMEVAERIVAAYDLPITPEEYLELAREQYKVLMPTAQLMPDTEKIYLGIIGDVLKQYNKPYPWVTRMRVLGTTEMKCAQIVCQDMQLPITPAEFHKKYTVLCHERLGNADLMPGAERIVRHLHKHNIPICLATSSGAEQVKVKTANYEDLFGLFHHKVMGSSDPEVKEGKPAPDIFLVAAKRFPDNPDPAQCLVFEDAPNGMIAGKAAGMQVVLVPDPHVAEEQRAGATLVLNNLNEIKLEDFGLPPFTE